MSLRRVSFKQFEGEKQEEGKQEKAEEGKSESNEPFCCRNYQKQIGIRFGNERVKEVIGERKSEPRNTVEEEKVEKCDDPISPFTFSGKGYKKEDWKGGTNWKRGEIGGTRLVNQPGKKELLVIQGDQGVEERRMLATREGVSNKKENKKDGESEMDRGSRLDAGTICSKLTTKSISSSHSFTSSTSTSRGDPHVNEQDGGNMKSNMGKTSTKMVKDVGSVDEENTQVKCEDKDFDSFYETGSDELDSYLYIDEDEDRDHHHFAKYFDGRNHSFRENRVVRNGSGEQRENCHSFRRVKSCRESGNDRESRMKGRKTLGMLINGPSSPPSSTPSTPPRDRTRSPTATTDRVNNGTTTENVNCGKVNGYNINYGKGMMRGENEGEKCECEQDDRSPSSTGTMDRFKSGYAAFRRSFDPRIVTFNCCSPSPPSFTPSPSQSDLDSPSLQSNPLPCHSQRQHPPRFHEESQNGCENERGWNVSSGPHTTARSLNQVQCVLNRNNNILNGQQPQQNQAQHQRNGIVRRNREDDEKRGNSSCKKGNRNNLTNNSSPTYFSLTSASFSPSLSSSDHPSSSMNDSSSSSYSSSTSSSNPKSKSFSSHTQSIFIFYVPTIYLRIDCL